MNFSKTPQNLNTSDFCLRHGFGKSEKNSLLAREVFFTGERVLFGIFFFFAVNSMFENVFVQNLNIGQCCRKGRNGDYVVITW